MHEITLLFINASSNAISIIYSGQIMVVRCCGNQHQVVLDMINWPYLGPLLHCMVIWSLAE